MSIDVSGGAGGVGATYQDLLSTAGALDDAGGGLLTRSDDVAALALDESLLASALLCPVTAARVGLALGAAAIGPSGLLPVAVGLEGSALLLRASVETYQLFDEVQRDVFEAMNNAAGWAAGAALPALALGVVGLALANPALTAALGAAVARNPQAFADRALTSLFDNPWLLEELTRVAPGLIQGAATGLTGGLAVPFLLSGGRWPAGDYESAVGGLVAAGNRFGAFRDDGDFSVVPADVHGAHAPTSVESVFEQQTALGEQDNAGQVQISTVFGNGTDAPPTGYIVQVPGTQEWSPVRGANPLDLTTNLVLMSGQDTALQQQVAAAMAAAEIPPGVPVLLTGHSQGGIACAAMAADPAFRERFNVTSVITGGSPIARFDIPADVSVLAVEHDQDPVPMLEGRENPDRANWVTVERDVGPDVAAAAAAADQPGVRSPIDAHSTTVYESTGAQIDAATDPSIRAWREQNQGFFAGPSTVLRFQIEGLP